MATFDGPGRTIRLIRNYAQSLPKASARWRG